LKLFDEKPVDIGTLLLTLVERVNKDDAIRYCLALISQLFKSGRARAFLRTTERHAKLPWSPFEKVLKRQYDDFYMNATAIGIYAQLVEEASAARVSVGSDIVSPLLQFVEQHLAKPDVDNVRIGCIGLRPLLSNDTYRRRFVLDSASGIDSLTKTLRTHAKSVQLVYEAAYCLWLLSFCTEVIASAPDALVRALVDCVRTQKKEKVLRVCIAALTGLCSDKRSEVRKTAHHHHDAAAAAANGVVGGGDGAPASGAAVAAAAAAAEEEVLEEAAEELDERQIEAQLLEAGEDVAALRLRQAHCKRHAETALDAGLMKPLTALRARTWADDELAADLDNLGRALARSVRALTSFEEYKKEVLSGELDWTPPHKSETFWHENVQQFDEDDFRLVKTLKVLASGDNTKVASIACYDLGEFARLHPRGRDILDQTGSKAVLIGLMASAKNVEVQKQALFAIQKLMVKKFDMIAS
jgi:hypothetical protein